MRNLPKYTQVCGPIRELLGLKSSLDSYHNFFRMSTYVSVLPGKLYYTRLGV